MLLTLQVIKMVDNLASLRQSIIIQSQVEVADKWSTIQSLKETIGNRQDITFFS